MKKYLPNTDIVVTSGVLIKPSDLDAWNKSDDVILSRMIDLHKDKLAPLDFYDLTKVVSSMISPVPFDNNDGIVTIDQNLPIKYTIGKNMDEYTKNNVLARTLPRNVFLNYGNKFYTLPLYDSEKNNTSINMRNLFLEKMKSKENIKNFFVFNFTILNNKSYTVNNVKYYQNKTNLLIDQEDLRFTTMTEEADADYIISDEDLMDILNVCYKNGLSEKLTQSLLMYRDGIKTEVATNFIRRCYAEAGDVIVSLSVPKSEINIITTYESSITALNSDMEEINFKRKYLKINLFIPKTIETERYKYSALIDSVSQDMWDADDNNLNIELLIKTRIGG